MLQVRSIIGQIRPDRQTLLFSATMPNKVERLVQDALTSPVRVTVGEVGAANDDIKQACTSQHRTAFDRFLLTQNLLWLFPIPPVEALCTAYIKSTDCQLCKKGIDTKVANVDSADFTPRAAGCRGCRGQRKVGLAPVTPAAVY